jgi:hypothetical protein
VQHIKKILQLRNLVVDIVVPLDEFGMLDNLNCLDADGVKQRNRIFRPNIKKGSDHTANVGANFDHAIHIVDLAQTFNVCLQRFAMGFNKVKFVLVSSNLFGLMIRIDFSEITLPNNAQNSNGVFLVTHKIKIGLLRSCI